MAELKLQTEREKIGRAQEEQATKEKNAAESTQTALDLAKRLSEHPGFGASYGNISSRFAGMNQSAVDAGAIRDQLVAALTLPNLGALKGAMSDKDILFVKQLATRLGNPRISEPEARQALADAQTFLQGKLGTAPVGQPPAKTRRYNPATGRVE